MRGAAHAWGPGSTRKPSTPASFRPPPLPPTRARPGRVWHGLLRAVPPGQDQVPGENFVRAPTRDSPESAYESGTRERRPRELRRQQRPHTPPAQAARADARRATPTAGCLPKRAQDFANVWHAFASMFSYLLAMFDYNVRSGGRL